MFYHLFYRLLLDRHLLYRIGYYLQSTRPSLDLRSPSAVHDSAARCPRGKDGVFAGFWEDKVLHIKKMYGKIQEIQDETSENRSKGDRTVDDIMLDQMKHKYVKECQELLAQMANEQQKAKKKV